jgi:hypothetical protein
MPTAKRLVMKWQVERAQRYKRPEGYFHWAFSSPHQLTVYIFFIACRFFKDALVHFSKTLSNNLPLIRLYAAIVGLRLGKNRRNMQNYCRSGSKCPAFRRNDRAKLTVGIFATMNMLAMCVDDGGSLVVI